MNSKIQISCLCIFLILIMLCFAPESCPAMIAAITIHELGHLIIAKLLGIRIGKLKLGILGAAIIPKRPLFSYKKELLLSVGGPVANFLSAYMISQISLHSLFFNSFTIYSISLGALNLLPIKSFDGGRIFSSLLLRKLSPSIVENILSVTSFSFIFTLWSISVYLLLKLSSSIPLFVFSISIFTKIFLSDIH